MFSVFCSIFYIFRLSLFLVELVLVLIMMPMMNNGHTFFHMKKMKDI